MCFGWSWFLTTLIWLVVVCGVVAIVRLLLPVVLGWLGVAGDLVMKVINILLCMVVIIALIWFAADMINCVGRI